MSGYTFAPDLVEQVSSDLKLREPNRQALAAVAERLDGCAPGEELVAELATGVGKTYIAGGLLDYLYESGGRNVVIVTPSSTIQSKTIGNLTPGHPKHIGNLACAPVVVTVDDYEQGTIADALDDEQRMKVFVLTVQSLLEGRSLQRRRAKRPHESVGVSLIDYLKGCDDLVVIADEHHVYFAKGAKQFRRAVEQLDPVATVGLTATPHEDTPLDSIVYSYSLAEAIADRWVKIPVLVARPDGAGDDRTRLADGVALLDAKLEAVTAWCDRTGEKFVPPVMFVVAQEIDEANRLADMLAEPDLLGPDGVLVVTSDESAEARQLLNTLEDANSPIRAVVSVSMLKEGWDVSNIYVVAAERALESRLLTEQILGRGLRLPFKRRTGNNMLDTVEVLSHRAFRDLLRDAEQLLTETLGQRAAEAAAVVQQMAGIAGRHVDSNSLDGHAADDERVRVALPAGEAPTRPGSDAGSRPDDLDVGGFSTVDRRIADAQESARALAVEVRPQNLEGASLPLYIPQVSTRTERDPFSLTDLDLTAIEALGSRWASTDAPSLRRKAVDARRDDEGVHIDISDLDEEVAASQVTLEVDTVVSDLVSRLLRSNAVAATVAERNAAIRVAESFLRGAGVSDGHGWTAEHARQAAGALVGRVQEKQSAAPRRQIVEVELARWPTPPGVRHLVDAAADRHRVGSSRDFERGWPYSGWRRAFYEVNAFDAYSTEFRLAELFDSSKEIAAWVRVDESVPLGIPYTRGGVTRRYRPDFLVIDHEGTLWVVEGKSDREIDSADTTAKHDGARGWVKTVNAHQDVPTRWAYLLASESVIGSTTTWTGLKNAASTA